MNAYYFSKLNRETSFSHFNKYRGKNVTVCFDLEDGVGDMYSTKRTSDLKNQQRELIYNLFKNQLNDVNEIKFGFRINETTEQLSDIETLSRINNEFSLFIPKVDSIEKFSAALEHINRANLKCKKIIPVIESKKGINILSEIIPLDKRIKAAAFGHCDYNLSENNFPFFHQDTLEYWKWVNKIIEKSGITFLNSPYLKLNDSAFFISILSHLNFLTAGNFGQIALTSLQTSLCLDFNNKPFKTECIAKNRHKLSLSKKDVEDYIGKYNSNYVSGKFAISGENIYYSPQEFISAERHLEMCSKPSLNIAFIGGCFPVQHNILFEEIFHSRLKRKIESEFKVNLNFNIIRYQRFRDCFRKLLKFGSDIRTDYVIFHIRPEPYLRLVKLYYRFQDYSYKFRKTLNILSLNLLGAEKYDDLKISRNVAKSGSIRKSPVRKFFININYIAGCLIGNYSKAAEYILDSINEIENYCQKKGIKFLVITPAAAQTSGMEKFLSERFSLRLEKLLSHAGVEYIKGADAEIKSRIYMYFEKGGKYAAKNYHEYISEKLYDYLIKGREIFK